MNQGHFLCGCNPDDPYIKNYHPYIIKINNEPRLTSKHYDKNGNEICPIHGKPKGPAHYKQGVQGNTVADYYADYILRYGKANLSKPIKSTMPDKRDNRDPSEVGEQLLNERRFATNIRANGQVS